MTGVVSRAGVVSRLAAESDRPLVLAAAAFFPVSAAVRLALSAAAFLAVSPPRSCSTADGLPAAVSAPLTPMLRRVRSIAGQRLLQRLGLVGDPELEEGAPLHDGLGPGGLGDAGQLDHDPGVAHLLDQRLGDAELVDALPQHGEREIEVALGIGRDLLGLVELEGEVHPTLEVEAQLERHPRLGPVVSSRRSAGSRSRTVICRGTR